MSIQFTDLARATAADGEISPTHLFALRQLEWDAGRIGRTEAEAILSLNRMLERPSGEWTDFFVETLSAWLLDDTGHCDGDAARWLTDALDAEGGVATMAELELLVRVIEGARGDEASESLSRCALERIEATVLTGEGPTRIGGPNSGQPRITGAECRLVRRILFASGGEARMPVAAEFLPRIDRATRDGDNSPEWPELLRDGTDAGLADA